MKTTADVLHISLLATIDILAMLANAIYMVIILLKTPKTMHSYSFLLFNIACVDFLASFCSIMSINKFQNFEGRIILIYIGPCAQMNAQWCHLFLGNYMLKLGNVNFMSQSVILLVLSFTYRLWVVSKGTHHEQSRLWTTSLFFICAFILVNSVLMFLGGSYEVHGFPSDRTISVLHLFGGSTESFMEGFSVFALLFTILIGFTLVFSIRRRLFERINRLNKTSDRYNHQQIYRSLTAQMLLPLANVLASLLWCLDFAGIMHSSVAQRSIFILSSLFALGSPLINMFYIPPYRKYDISRINFCSNHHCSRSGWHELNLLDQPTLHHVIPSRYQRNQYLCSIGPNSISFRAHYGSQNIEHWNPQQQKYKLSFHTENSEYQQNL